MIKYPSLDKSEVEPKIEIEEISEHVVDWNRNFIDRKNASNINKYAEIEEKAEWLI